MANATISYPPQNENEVHRHPNPTPTPNNEPEEIPNPYATGELPVGNNVGASYGGAAQGSPFAAMAYPQNLEQAYLDTFQAVLQSGLGEFVVIEFLIGTDGITEKSGLLYAVGNNFVTLYDIQNGQYIVCDLFSVKFVTFYYSQPPYGLPNNNRPTDNGNIGGRQQSGGTPPFAGGTMMPNGMRLRTY